MAQEVLAILGDCAPPEMAKLLPGFAMKLAKERQEITVKIILEHARQGIDHLKAPRAIMPDQKMQDRTYKSVIRKLYEKDAYIKAMRDAVVQGDIETIKRNYNSESDNNRILLQYSIEKDQLDILDFFIDKNPRDIESSLVMSAGGGHINAVRHLDKNHHQSIYKSTYGAMQTVAAENGHLEIVRLVNKIYPRSPYHMLVAMMKATDHGHTKIADFLLENIGQVKEGDIHCALKESYSMSVAAVQRVVENASSLSRDEKKYALSNQNIQYYVDSALNRSNPALVDYFAGFLIDHMNFESERIYDYFSEEDRYRINAMKESSLDWKKVTHCDVPFGLVGEDPHLFYPKPFALVRDALTLEGYSEFPDLAFAVAALFDTEDRVLDYLERWGTPGKQPLHDIIHMIKMPEKRFKNDTYVANFKAWGDAVLKCGPSLAKLFVFANKIPVPEKSADGKTWSYTRTRDKVAQFRYTDAKECPELAALCYDQGVTEGDFDDALVLVQKQQKNIIKNIPDITIDGKTFDMEGISFHQLPSNDIRGLFLGKLVDCCQSIGGAGSECAEYGFMSKDSGFYVVETAKGEIVGEIWAWRGKKGELVFDSLETLGKRVTPQQWQKISTAFATALEKKPTGVTAFNIGTGGGTPAVIKETFKKASAQPKDYKGYRDSKQQVCVWKRKKPISRKPKPQ